MISLQLNKVAPCKKLLLRDNQDCNLFEVNLKIPILKTNSSITILFSKNIQNILLELAPKLCKLHNGSLIQAPHHSPILNWNSLWPKAAEAYTSSNTKTSLAEYWMLNHDKSHTTEYELTRQDVGYKQMVEPMKCISSWWPRDHTLLDISDSKTFQDLPMSNSRTFSMNSWTFNAQRYTHILEEA